MPQTTDGVPLSCGRIDISILPACTGWADVSGSAQSITPEPRNKMVGEENTLDGEGPIVEAGKFEAHNWVVRIVYTETVGEAYQLLYDAFNTGDCDGKVCLRYIPSGGAGGQYYQSNYAPVIIGQLPPVSAAEAGPIMVEFTVRVTSVTDGVFVS